MFCINASESFKIYNTNTTFGERRYYNMTDQTHKPKSMWT